MIYILFFEHYILFITRISLVLTIFLIYITVIYINYIMNSFLNIINFEIKTILILLIFFFLPF